MFVGPWALWLRKKYGMPVIYTYHTRYEDYLHYIPCFRINERVHCEEESGGMDTEESDPVLYEMVLQQV